jgi:hypothetical protein
MSAHGVNVAMAGDGCYVDRANAEAIRVAEMSAHALTPRWLATVEAWSSHM